MSLSKWFDDKYYAEQKIMQMNTTIWRGKSDWDEVGYRSELARFGVTAEENFEACNTANYVAGIAVTAVNISPNRLFDIGVYLQNYVNWANGAGNYSYGTIESGQWTVQTMLSHIFDDLHMSAWAHFQQVGMDLELNPSNLFDTSKYLANCATAMNTFLNADGSHGWQGRTNWTKIDVLKNIKANDANPITDYFDFGNSILNVQAAKPENPTVVTAIDGWTPWGTITQKPDDGQTPSVPGVKPPHDTPGSGSSPSTPTPPKTETIILTAENSNYAGTNGANTSFQAAYYGENEQRTTIKPNYSIDGGTGDNTLSIECGADWPGFNDGKGITNVSSLELDLAKELTGKIFTFIATNIGNVENIAIDNSGAREISLTDIGNSVSAIAVTGEDAADFSITQTEGLKQPTEPSEIAINGKINNLTYSVDYPEPGSQQNGDPIKFMPAVLSDATGDISVNVNGYARVIGNSKFSFEKAGGDVKVTVAENATWGHNLELNASKAQNFTLDSKGALGSNDIYTVVNESSDQNGSVKISALGKGMTYPAGSNPAGITLNAKGASTFELETKGEFRIAAGDLSSAKAIKLSLSQSEAGKDYLRSNENDFDMSKIDLPSAGALQITSNGMNAYLGNIGDVANNEALDIAIKDVNRLEIGHIYNNGKIDIDVTSNDVTKIGNIINKGNDISLTFSSKDVESNNVNQYGNFSPVTFEGKDIIINCENVQHDVFTAGIMHGGDGVFIKSSSNFKYIGSKGNEFVRIAELGNHGTADIDFGDGRTSDYSVLTLFDLPNSATINVTCGKGGELIEIMPQTSQLIVNVKDFNITATKTDLLNIRDMSVDSLDITQGKELLTHFGILGDSDTISELQVLEINDYGMNTKGIQYENNVYIFDTNEAATANLMVVLEGIADDFVNMDS